jgi:hypothetical protein
VVIHNFHFFRAVCAMRPLKADAPLLVYSDTVLTLPVSRQGLKVDAVQLRQVEQPSRGFKHPQSFLGLMTETLEGCNPLPLSEAFGFSILETPDQF